MSKIEAAAHGIVCGVPQLKTSNKGNPWLSFSMRIGDGANASFAQIAVFENAAELAGKVVRGASVYIEGGLTLSTWQTAQGEHKAGLNIAARFVRVAAIGRNMPKREQRQAPTRGGREYAPEFDDQIPL